MNSDMLDANFSELINEREILVSDTSWIERMLKDEDNFPMDLDETIETLRAIRLRIHTIDLTISESSRRKLNRDL